MRNKKFSNERKKIEYSKPYWKTGVIISSVIVGFISLIFVITYLLSWVELNFIRPLGIVVIGISVFFNYFAYYILFPITRYFFQLAPDELFKLPLFIIGLLSVILLGALIGFFLDKKNSMKKKIAAAIIIAVLLIIQYAFLGLASYYNDQAWNVTDKKMCDNMILPREMNFCYFKLASNLGSSEPCGRIDSSEGKHLCYTQIAEETLNETICNEIPFDEFGIWKESCQDSVKIRNAFAQNCQGVDTSELKEDCCNSMDISSDEPTKQLVCLEIARKDG